MVNIPPTGSSDFFDIAQQFTGGSPQPADGFQASKVPSTTGLGTRQGRIPSDRTAVTGRKLVHWLVPEGPIVQMYCNPQEIKYNYKKNIASQRTKGGWILQYWGEDLTTLNISGTTGTSGIEGINVLHDIYRNEQIAFDPYALFLAQKQSQDTNAGEIFGFGSALADAASGSILNSLTGAAEQAFPQAAQQGPTLASLAFQVEMYWSGEVYRGFFTDFSVTESVNKLGMFDYTINLTVTQKRGFRRNFLAWHRSPTAGPSNSNPQFGPPHSFGGLVDGSINPPRRLERPQSDVIGAFEGLADDFSSLFG
jgi:hypothetical protein